MRGLIAVGGIVALTLASCSQRVQKSEEALTAYDIETPPGEAPPPPPAPSAAPQIAYSYSLTYRLGGNRIGAVQQRQIALCSQLGAARCRIVSSSVGTTGEGSGHAFGETKLLIDARLAQSFMRRLDDVVGNAGGETAARQTNAEDVTKQIIDTDARVRAKQALADRLMRVIQTADGKVGDLVAAERAFADVQEELDAARSNQAALRQRVAMSDITISYAAREASSIASPVTDSIRNAGMTLGTSVATLLNIAISALPWLLAVAGLGWLLRRLGWRGIARRIRRRNDA